MLEALIFVLQAFVLVAVCGAMAYCLAKVMDWMMG